MKVSTEKSLHDLLASANKDIKDSENIWWFFAAFTDALYLDEWKTDGEIAELLRLKSKRLLELHIFSEKAEYRAIRGNLGSDLKCCKITETLSEEKNYFDERQYLDIDMKQVKARPSGGWVVKTIGGGTYTVPLNVPEEKLKNSAIVIRNYVNYYKESGQAYVQGSRIVKLAEGV